MKYNFCEKHNLKYNAETSDECADCIEEKSLKVEKISPAMAGHYRALIAKKEIENSRLGETRNFLAVQVKMLRKMCAFLEFRKRELEDGIKGLENNIRIGIDMMDELEDNEKFIEITQEKKS